MSDATTPQVTDAPSTDAASTDAPSTSSATPSPFTMVTGDAAAMVCEGDVCYIPGVGE
ncbi:hypothetical protein [Agromyces bauzanensis]|uniref:Uncharacterized protein n=1 Tax=Agromyces bauzanensis TaxID=1308924 RepID=A0A917PAQ9_9MICO|nr:hypothetical protein [Agromyces bauzanensis]GGJ68666.1 hypothetical protein GCM10011372_03080 [Agromyces bauzanensis]